MNLLNDEKLKKPESKGKKLVLTLLILSLILLILIVIAMTVLSIQPKVKTYTLFIDDVQIEMISDLIITDSSNNRYIALKDIEKQMGYTYYNGEYLSLTEEKTKCYLENDNEIIGFEAGTKKIYKTKANATLEYQYYTLSKEIIKGTNDKLYIALDDLVVVFNVVYSYSEQILKANIYTADFKTKEYKEKITKDKTYDDISSDYNNKKAISYNMIVVEKDSKFGVINSAFETIIGTKYSSMNFDEYTKTFIVKSSNNKFGVIDKTGEGIIDINYDSLRIINYSPLLYEVKKNNQFGVINEEGKTIVNIEYNSFGYAGDEANNIDPLLIVTKINGDEDRNNSC